MSREYKSFIDNFRNSEHGKTYVEYYKQMGDKLHAFLHNDMHVACLIYEMIGQKRYDRAARRKDMFFYWFQIEFIEELNETLMTLTEDFTCYAFRNLAKYIFQRFNHEKEVNELFDHIQIRKKYEHYMGKDEYERAYMQMRDHINSINSINK
jgi:hypothetical protein